MLHNFEIRGEKIRFWQNRGESFEHILMKALGYAMFIREHPDLEIEKRVGLKYKPDLIVQNGKRDFDFWGECGQNANSKTAWLLKHTRINRFALFKIGLNVDCYIKQIRKDIPKKYRPDNKLILINFVSNIKALNTDKVIDKVPESWFEKHYI